MGSPADNQPESQAYKRDTRGSEKSKPNWMNQIDAELAFRLVDSILPFEACLYHQILPLSLEGSRLKLGMVNPDDSAALDYVRRILAYMNCSLVPQAIASDVHYAALSAYLNYSDQKKASATSQPFVRKIAKKLTEQAAKQPAGSPNHSTENPNINPTFVVDSPDVLPPLQVENGNLKQEQSFQAHHPLSARASVPTPTSEAIAAHEDKLLEIQPQHLTDLPEVLATLPPAQLLEELLGRVVSSGIGRLYFERQPESGRILWSQNGVLQAVLENLPLKLFEQVIQELKQFSSQPLIPIQKSKQVEFERVYHTIPLLFRLRLIPGKHGDEATLQALRDDALTFYRQQQLSSLSQDTIQAAQYLQQKLSSLYAYSQLHSVALPSQLNTVPELKRLLQQIHHQLNELQALNFDNPSKDES